jgi:hypothetical protein
MQLTGNISPLSPLWKRSSRASAELAERLDELGLFDLMDAGPAARAKEALARKGIEALWKLELGRDAFAGDSEDLAEGGVGAFLEELRPYLVQRGVTLGEIEDGFDDDGRRYEVRVGDDVHTIFDATAGDPVEHAWGLAWVRAFRLVNGLLAAAGSPERAYTMPEENVWFLTPEQFEALRLAIPEPRDRPYEPVDDAPWYGAEH